MCLNEHAREHGAVLAAAREDVHRPYLHRFAHQELRHDLGEGHAVVTRRLAARPDGLLDLTHQLLVVVVLTARQRDVHAAWAPQKPDAVRDGAMAAALPPRSLDERVEDSVLVRNELAVIQHPEVVLVGDLLPALTTRRALASSAPRVRKRDVLPVLPPSLLDGVPCHRALPGGLSMPAGGAHRGEGTLRHAAPRRESRRKARPPPGHVLAQSRTHSETNENNRSISLHRLLIKPPQNQCETSNSTALCSTRVPFLFLSSKLSYFARDTAGQISLSNRRAVH